MSARRGRLVVVATPIGNLGDLSPRAADALRAADLIACEDTRRTRRLLSATGIGAPRLMAVHGENERAQVATVVALVEQGGTVALVSDAGSPGVSDPGRVLVAAVADAGHSVEVVPGPSAVVTALSASGLPAERFVFEGFLPRKGPERRARLAAIAEDERTTVVYEAPSRVTATLTELGDVCGADRLVVVARELTKLHEEIRRGPLRDIVRWATENELRGEFVFVIGGRPEGDRPEIDDAVILAALADARAAGASNREAASDVSIALDVPRNRVYKLAIRPT
ncbi:MAG TPA: 16S rRNA (cytidine(1402)-2'-O)-methyltransferase [Acidimicrobiales bacterium]|nr:16S rRNA (cytidine(1402)-2'-O)-methyltransferase [Acidimicrobiales bacterium]